MAGESAQLTHFHPALPPARPASAIRRLARFAAHFVEMVLAMSAGMAAGGVLGVQHVSSIELRTVLWLVVMTVPMVVWMRIRRHGARRATEMSVAMAAPAVAALSFHWLGAIPGSAVIGIEHTAMAPAMLALMVYRREHFGW